MLVFVMYYIYVTSGSSLLIESTDSMIKREGEYPIPYIQGGANALWIIKTLQPAYEIKHRVQNPRRVTKP